MRSSVPATIAKRVLWRGWVRRSQCDGVRPADGDAGTCPPIPPPVRRRSGGQFVLVVLVVAVVGGGAFEPRALRILRNQFSKQKLRHAISCYSAVEEISASCHISSRAEWLRGCVPFSFVGDLPDEVFTQPATRNETRQSRIIATQPVRSVF